VEGWAGWYRPPAAEGPREEHPVLDLLRLPTSVRGAKATEDGNINDQDESTVIVLQRSQPASSVFFVAPALLLCLAHQALRLQLRR
jgi:hypothetical protein